VRSSRQQLSARPLPRLRPLPRPPPPINNRTNPLQLAVHAQTWERKEVETGEKMVQKDSVKTSRPCASFTTIRSSGSSCPPASFNSLVTLAANLRASSSSCRIVPFVLPYSLTLSRHVTTKWYRGKCAPLSASENSGSIIGL
jgi:hypothetical protein